MEYIMYLLLGRQLQFVSLFSYCMEDSEESKKLPFKLFVPLCFDVFTIQPDFLAQSIATAFNSFIINFFLQLLCMEQVLAASFYHLSQLFSQFVSRARSKAGVNIFSKKNSEVVAAIEFEQDVTGTSILSIVIGKFYHW